MAVAIINPLKVIDIDIQHGHEGAFAAHQGMLFGVNIGKATAV
jgi:hypothetical protein